MNLYSRRWCDLIFEGRNKDYGAYTLRRHSDGRHLLSFLAVVVLLGLGLGLHYLIEMYRFQRFQQGEDNAMVEQYQLLDAIADEQLIQEYRKPTVKLPTDATHTATAITNTPTEVIRPDQVQIVDDLQPETDPYLKELKEEKKEEKDDKPEKKEETTDDEQLYTSVDLMPSFPNGETGLMEYVAKNLRYLIPSHPLQIENKVLVAFFIEVNGTISNIQVLESIDPVLDREAVRVVRMLPRWRPAMKNGKAIRVKYILPISFRSK
jgi:protein TonB